MSVNNYKKSLLQTPFVESCDIIQFVLKGSKISKFLFCWMMNFLAVNQLLCTKSHLLWVGIPFLMSQGVLVPQLDVVLDLSGFPSVFQFITLYFHGFNFHELLN